MLCVMLVACGRSSLFRQYEYEEDIHLSLDGTATVYVNASIPALNALRGTAFEAGRAARVDAGALRAYYSTPGTHVNWVRQSRRSNRRFVHVRVEVNDINRLAEAAPFAWSVYRFQRDGDVFTYRQTVGAPAGKAPATTGLGAEALAKAAWKGDETVAVRLHLPSEITFHNTGTDVRRGNILVWEQPLSARLRGTPLELDARMSTQSILYRTLWLFAATFVAVTAAFAIVIWRLLRRGGRPAVEEV